MPTFLNPKVRLEGDPSNIVSGTVQAESNTINSINTTDGSALVQLDDLYRESAGDWFSVLDISGNAATNNIVVDFSGASRYLQGTSSTQYTLDKDRQFVTFAYAGSPIGWVVIDYGVDYSFNDFKIENVITFAQEFDNGTDAGTVNIDFSQANNHVLTVSGATTLTFTPPSEPATLRLRLVQSGAGNTTTLPTIKWPRGAAPTISSTDTEEDLLVLWYNGTSYYGSAGLGYA